MWYTDSTQVCFGRENVPGYEGLVHRQYSWQGYMCNDCTVLIFYFSVTIPRVEPSSTGSQRGGELVLKER